MWRGFRVFIIVAAFLTAAAYMSWVDGNNRSVWSENPANDWQGALTGRIVSPVKIDGNRVQFTLKSESWQSGDAAYATGGEDVLIRLFAKTETELERLSGLQRGDRLRVPVTLEQPQGVRNPGGFDYRRHLYEQRIHWVGRVRAGDEIGRLPSTGLGHWQRPIDQLRDYLSGRMAAVYDEPAAGLVRGMILGERQAVDLHVEREFATLGLMHLLAISGLHVGIVLAICYGGLKWFGVSRERAALVALFFLPFYALLTGAAAPVVRAALVGGLVLLAVIFRQWKNSVHFLALAAAVMLLWNPYELFSVSFQLSFIITFGIVAAVPAVSARIPFGPPFVKTTLATTFIAQVCAFPLIIYYFNEFSLLSGLANLLIVPIVSAIVIPLSFVTVILAALAVPFAILPAYVNGLVIEGVLWFSDLFSNMEPFHLTWATPSVWLVCLYYAACALFFWAWVRRPLSFQTRTKALSLIALGIILFTFYFPYPWWNRPLTVTFLDVGQGDAVVIETPERQTIVYDAGGRPFFEEEPWQRRRDPFDVGEDVVLPFLRHKGVRKIDYLVMSHGDADHIGGMEALVSNVPIRAFVRGPDTIDPSEVEQELLAALNDKNVPIYRAASGAGWELEEGLYWQFIQPAPEKVTAGDRNAQSVVLRLVYGGRSILLTGDADEAVEKLILREWALPPIDVLKAGHHGSNTSTSEAWLQQIRPRITILSAGTGNRYNHPHPEVVDRLEQAGSRIYRTDEDGGITVTIDKGGRMTIEPTVVDPLQRENGSSSGVQGDLDIHSN